MNTNNPQHQNQELSGCGQEVTVHHAECIWNPSLSLLLVNSVREGCNLLVLRARALASLNCRRSPTPLKTALFHPPLRFLKPQEFTAQGLSLATIRACLDLHHPHFTGEPHSAHTQAFSRFCTRPLLLCKCPNQPFIPKHTPLPNTHTNADAGLCPPRAVVHAVGRGYVLVLLRMVNLCACARGALCVMCAVFCKAAVHKNGERA
jgi:hypothetical protein